MTGSGSTMVAVISPGTSDEEITVLKQGILSEFGETMWVTESDFLQ
jgi:hypothetical protein